jgi:catechol 2,3-dioxygenase-like lactoylglutathione lyase family enzyme
MGIRVGLIQINVRDREASRRFYVDVLGLREKKTGFGPEGPVLLANPGGPDLLVYAAPKAAKSAYPDGTGVVLVFYVKDLDATIRRWRRRRVRFVRIGWSQEASGAADCPFGRFVAFRDPSGTVHEVLEPRGKRRG